MTLTREVFDLLADVGDELREVRSGQEASALQALTEDDMRPFGVLARDYRNTTGNITSYVLTNPRTEVRSTPKFFAWLRRFRAPEVNAIFATPDSTRWGPAHPEWDAFWDKAEAAAKDYCTEYDKIVAAVGGRPRMRKIRVEISVPVEQGKNASSYVTVPAGSRIVRAEYLN